MTQAVELRSPTVGDAARLATLLGELGYRAQPAQVARRLELLAAEPETRLFVAVLDGEVVGLAGLRVERLVESDEPAGRLIALIVASSQRRRGIGAQLVVAVEAEARHRGCSSVVLTSAHRRCDAHAFYEQLGYEETGRRFAKRLC